MFVDSATWRYRVRWIPLFNINRISVSRESSVCELASCEL